jgi:hypothetical protein
MTLALKHKDLQGVSELEDDCTCIQVKDIRELDGRYKCECGGSMFRIQAKTFNFKCAVCYKPYDNIKGFHLVPVFKVVK